MACTAWEKVPGFWLCSKSCPEGGAGKEQGCQNPQPRPCTCTVSSHQFLNQACRCSHSTDKSPVFLRARPRPTASAHEVLTLHSIQPCKVALSRSPPDRRGPSREGVTPGLEPLLQQPEYLIHNRPWTLWPHAWHRVGLAANVWSPSKAPLRTRWGLVPREAAGPSKITPGEASRAARPTSWQALGPAPDTP